MNGQINPNRQRPNRSRSAAVSLTLVAFIAGSTMAETWTDNTRTYKVEAELLGIEQDDVYLTKTNLSQSSCRTKFKAVKPPSRDKRHETHATFSLLACQFVASGLHGDEGIDHLARKLIQAISVNDPIAYAQCFTTIDQNLDGLQKMFPRITENELNRFRKKFHDRNVGIRHSFDIIRKQIPETESKVVFVSAEADGFEDIDAIDATSCSTIRLRFSIDGLPWTLTLDDGILLGNYWYLGDDPVSLESERTKINLRMFKGEYGHETTKQPTP